MPDISSFSHLIQHRPKDRLPVGFQSKLNDNKLLIDVHTHLFNVDDVPRDYLGIRMDIPAEFLRTIQAILDATHVDDHLLPAKFRRLIDNILSTPTQLLAKLEGAYAGYQRILVVLMMDMRSLGRLNRHTYRQQIEALEALMELHPDTILPFLAIDPNQPDFIDYFKEVFTRDNRIFHGLKLYPSLGYLPSHPNLMDIYGICEEKKIPITAHCSSALVNLRKRQLMVEGLDRAGKAFRKTVKLPSRYTYKHYFNDPARWIPVLKKHPGLKVNLAHYGGAKAWAEYQKGANGKKDGKWVHTINALLHGFEGVYTDFSYTMYDRSATQRLVEDIRNGIVPEDKILYGSDFFLIENEGSQEELFRQFRDQVGTALFTKMSQENNLAFLF